MVSVHMLTSVTPIYFFSPIYLIIIVLPGTGNDNPQLYRGVDFPSELHQSLPAGSKTHGSFWWEENIYFMMHSTHFFNLQL